jgi:hypothetical protein
MSNVRPEDGIDQWRAISRAVIEIQSPLYARDPRGKTLEADLVTGVGLVAVGHLTLYQAHGAFEAGHTMFQIADILGDLIDSSVDVAQVLKDRVVDLRAHDVPQKGCRVTFAV